MREECLRDGWLPGTCALPERPSYVTASSNQMPVLNATHKQTNQRTNERTDWKRLNVLRIKDIQYKLVLQ